MQSDACACAGLVVAQKTPLETELSKALLAPNQPLIEVQVYTAAHARFTPAVSSAAQWDQVSQQIRLDVLDKSVFRGEAKRWRDATTRVEWLDTLAGVGYRVREATIRSDPGTLDSGLTPSKRFCELNGMDSHADKRRDSEFAMKRRAHAT